MEKKLVKFDEDIILCGIYVITNTLNGKIYIGQSKNIHKRWNDHMKPSKDTSNSIIHKALKKYNHELFNFEIIELCGEIELREKEIFYIKERKSFVENGGYNLTLGGDGLFGFKHNENTRKKCGAVNKGKPLTEEHKVNIKAGMIDCKRVLTDQGREAIIKSKNSRKNTTQWIDNGQKELSIKIVDKYKYSDAWSLGRLKSSTNSMLAKRKESFGKISEDK
jgi:group I intron endonuclease